MIEITSLHKHFGPLHVLKGIDISVEKGKVCAIIGPSGSGKSTLLRCVNYLETYDEGLVTVDGDLVGRRLVGGRAIADRADNIQHVRKKMGMVFQQFNLFPHLTALQNVAAGPVHVLGVDKVSANKAALELLARVGLSDKAGSYPQALSGGQQQRVAIARSLAMQPKIMLFDEATSALDPELVGEVLAVIRQLADQGMTMMLVTHEISFAREVADQIVFMAEGVVVERGAPAQVLESPSTERTRSFLQRFRT
ncbi:amino acid ABC transporter ATP-binding protein [Mesorhizobium sp. 113-3-3]|uniref:amino acid ABC transporter ATP-binding protein n=1 Tax=Mesorhizobium sp. 113-3-3 TaxID=2744516 RepID=UPI001928A959|nr:amino acid ABC transporter ATP-binding protein [Mesorhizobium sp. 113-3-3]BCG82172.1 arginine ABC transporter ATP-binding protein [Mesorhizobium sp. 113-3-3]